MAFAPTTPITGGAQTGLTSPTYTITADTPPSSTSKQFAVTALGGTQTGVLAHSVSSPFTLTAHRPAVFKPLGAVNPVTGVLKSVPNNVFKVHTRKGVIPLAGQNPRVMSISSSFEVPAGADIADPLSIRAAISAHIGLLTQISASFGDTTVSGIL